MKYELVKSLHRSYKMTFDPKKAPQSAGVAGVLPVFYPSERLEFTVSQIFLS